MILLDSFKGYSNFNDVDNDLLRIWNITQTAVEITSTIDSDTGEAYLDQFSEEDRMKVKILLLGVSTQGKEDMQRRVNEAIEIFDKEQEEADGE